MNQLISSIYFLIFYDLFGPLIFTVVKLKRRPAITSSVSFGLGSCPFTLSYSIPFTLVLAILKIIVMHVIQINKFDADMMSRVIQDL